MESMYTLPGWERPEKLAITKKEFRERFDEEFRVFSRLLKEMGKYKFLMKYLFSHNNKSKDDLFETICRLKSDRNVLHYQSLATSLIYLDILGFKDWTEFTPDDSDYWSKNIKPIHIEITNNRDKFINDKKIITLVD